MSRPTASRPLLAAELRELVSAGVLHVSLSEAARVLGLGEDRARRLASSGIFPVPVFRIGKTIRVPVAGLTRVLAIEDVVHQTAVAPPSWRGDVS